MNAETVMPPSGDLSHDLAQSITTNDAIDLRVALFQFRQAFNRIAQEWAVQAVQIHEMNRILGKSVFQFAKKELGLSSTAVNRYLQTYEFLEANCSTDGKIDLLVAGRYNQSVIKLLSTSDGHDVIDEVRELAAAGTSISDSAIKRLIESRKDAEDKATLSNEVLIRDAKLISLKQQLHDAEGRDARSQATITNLETINHRHEEAIAAFEEEVTQLRAANVQVTETIIEKEVPPKGYESAAQALAILTTQTEQADKRKQQLTSETEALEQRKQQLAAEVAAKEIASIKSAFEATLLQFPAPKLAALAKADRYSQQVMSDIGKSMVEFGQKLLQCAVAANP